jgi:hypothetical protein
MAASDEKKMIVGNTLNANGCSRNRSPKTNRLPISVRSETHVKASPIAAEDAYVPATCAGSIAAARVQQRADDHDSPREASLVLAEQPGESDQ